MFKRTVRPTRFNKNFNSFPFSKNDAKAKHEDKNKNTCSVVLGFFMKPPGFSTVE